MLPEIATPHAVELVAEVVLMLQFLTTLLVAPSPRPRLDIQTPQGAVVAEFVRVRLRSVPPLLLPSMIK